MELRALMDEGIYGGAFMQPAAYRQAIVEFIRAQAKPRDKFSHQSRLYELARTLGAGHEYDDDVLYAAAWLHDLGVFVGHRPEDPTQLAKWDHIAYALRETPPFLRKIGFPERKIPAVLEAIRDHLPSSQPSTVEGKLLRDADILEQLGAVGILRTLSKVGRDTRFPTHHDAVGALSRSARELPALLSLPLARKMAEERLVIMTAFLGAARAELAIEPECDN